jgi:peptidase C39-like protein
MIYGCKYWNDRGKFFIQTNNPTEEILKKSGIKNYLESCGPTSAVNCLSAMGRNVDIDTPGGYRPQPEEILTDFFNDPRNYKQLQKERSGIKPGDYLGNEIAQYYPLAVKSVFGIRCRFTYANFNNIAEYLKDGFACQICFKNPGHFVAAVAFDDEKKEIIFNDPMGKFNSRLPEDQKDNLKNYCIIYY